MLIRETRKIRLWLIQGIYFVGRNCYRVNRLSLSYATLQTNCTQIKLLLCTIMSLIFWWLQYMFNRLHSGGNWSQPRRTLPFLGGFTSEEEEMSVCHGGFVSAERRETRRVASPSPCRVLNGTVLLSCSTYFNYSPPYTSSASVLASL